MTPRIVTITGPSCAGKSTLESLLVEEFPAIFKKGISTTTRMPRPGERDGDNYHFVSRESFESLCLDGLMLESVSFGGNLYGISREEIESITLSEKIAVVVCEPCGMRQIRAYCQANRWEHFGIFVDADPELIFKRMLERTMLDLLKSSTERGVPIQGQIGELASKHARRYAEAATTERRWVDDFQTGRDMYSLCVREFTQETQCRVVHSIMNGLGFESSVGCQK